MHLRNNKGFTLIEVMITVAILGIITAIALPQYEQYVREARRSDGTGSLLTVSHNLERCGSTFGRYNHPSCDVLAPVGGVDSNEGNYRITIAVRTASTYRYAAVAQNQQVADNAFCNNFTIDQTGTKGASGSETVNRCWRDG